MIVCYMVDMASLDMKMALLSAEDGHFIRYLKTPVITNLDLSWTTDSRSVIYATDQQGVSNIWSQPVDNGPARQLTGFKSDLIFRFAPSADGKSLAYERGTNINDVVVISHLF
jgi:Tol biopolymer transport system component